MMIIALLIIFIYILKIHLKQNINISLKIWKNDLENFKERKILIEHSNKMQGVYKIIEDCNPTKNEMY